MDAIFAASPAMPTIAMMRWRLATASASSSSPASASDASLIAPGVDTRGLVQDDATRAAGQFILPGSVRTDGKQWRWCDDVPDDFDPRQASYAPEAVIREASLTKYMRDLMASDPVLKAKISESPPADIQRIIEDFEAARRAETSGRTSALAHPSPPLGPSSELPRRDDNPNRGVFVGVEDSALEAEAEERPIGAVSDLLALGEAVLAVTTDLDHHVAGGEQRIAGRTNRTTLYKGCSVVGKSPGKRVNPTGT